MSPYGKASLRFLSRAVLPSLGARSPVVLEGPGAGVDNAVLRVARDRVLIVTTDPVSVIHRFGMKLSAWMSVHLIASDYATSGSMPQFATFVFNFPRALKGKEREDYVREVGDACKKLGVAIVSGHTGGYPGASLTVIGAGSMFGFSRDGEYVTSRMARDGDIIMVTKGAAIEAAASLARSFPSYTEKRLGAKMATAAAELTWRCSTVEDSMLAASVGLGIGGVTSMHDATEGGVLGGLQEMARASRKAFVVEPDRIPVTDEVGAVCGLYGLNPLSSLSEGTLIFTCSPSAGEGIAEVFRKRRIRLAPIGHVQKGAGLWTADGSGGLRRTAVAKDGYWKAYHDSVASNLH